MLALVASFLLATAVPAQDTTELLNRMKAMEDRIRALETEVQTLKGQQTAAVAPQPQPAPVEAPAVAQAPPEPVSIGGAGGAAAKVLNPDISVIGDFIGAIGNHGGRATPSLEMHESEVGFQEVIDPYARADFFISFGEAGVNLEEGYITFTSLPAGLQLRVGKMRAAFGRVNTTHNHVLPWIDRPLVSQNLVGGDDGIDDAGLVAEPAVSILRRIHSSTASRSNATRENQALTLQMKRLDRIAVVWAAWLSSWARTTAH